MPGQTCYVIPVLSSDLFVTGLVSIRNSLDQENLTVGSTKAMTLFTFEIERTQDHVFLWGGTVIKLTPARTCPHHFEVSNRSVLVTQVFILILP